MQNVVSTQRRRSGAAPLALDSIAQAAGRCNRAKAAAHRAMHVIVRPIHPFRS